MKIIRLSSAAADPQSLTRVPPRSFGAAASRENHDRAKGCVPKRGVASDHHRPADEEGQAVVMPPRHIALLVRGVITFVSDVMDI